MAFPDIPVLALPSEVTTDRIEEIEGDADCAIGEEGAFLVIDLARTTFICSSGLGMLVKVSKRLHERGGAVAIARAMPAIGRLLKMVGLDPVLPAFASVEAASVFLAEGREARAP